MNAATRETVEMGGGPQARPCIAAILASDSKSESDTGNLAFAGIGRRRTAFESVRPSERLWRGTVY